MKKLDFNPHKSTQEFRNNYKLHDLAETLGKNLLVQWGFSFRDFGQDNRFQKVWERGEDKPDIIMEYKGKTALLDWKGKHKPVWLINRRAFNSYGAWKEKLNMPVFVAFAVFDGKNNLTEFKFACLGKHSFIASTGKEWDKNATVEFEMDLPEFNKSNILKFL